jgi:hypothetical protein
LSPFCRLELNELMGPAAMEAPDSPFTFCEALSVVGLDNSISTCVVGLFRFAKKFVGVFDFGA